MTAYLRIRQCHYFGKLLQRLLEGFRRPLFALMTGSDYGLQTGVVSGRDNVSLRFRHSQDVGLWPLADLDELAFEGVGGLLVVVRLLVEKWPTPADQ